MKWFPTRLFIACLIIGVASAHNVCKYERISLGITKTSAECQSKCIACKHPYPIQVLLNPTFLYVVVDADDATTTRDCIAWGHSSKDEKCSAWILENDPEEYDDFYGIGSYYEGYYGDYETCVMAQHTNISTAHTKGANKKKGCFFEIENLGFAETPEDCRALCEGCETSWVNWTLFLKSLVLLF